MRRLIPVALLAMAMSRASLERATAADRPAIVTPNVAGLNVKLGKTVPIRAGANYPVVFQFVDGRISVGWGDPKAGRWSDDGGTHWRDGPAPPGEASIQLDNNEVLSLGFALKRRPEGTYALPQRRSLDGWKTVTEEVAQVVIPQSVPAGGDGGERNDGFLVDHAVLRLKDGRLIAAMYGNYDADKTLADDYPASMHFNKYRTIVVSSSDRGRTWGNPITVATATAAMQEGPCEPDLTRAGNGDILCAMRSGGLPSRSTPCFISRSTDEGRTWSRPDPVLDRGVWPSLCVMRNGIIVLSTGRPGDWLTFSKDQGRTWEGAFSFCTDAFPATTSYTTALEVARDTLLVVYDRKAPADPDGGKEIVGTFFTVQSLTHGASGGHSAEPPASPGQP